MKIYITKSIHTLKSLIEEQTGINEQSRIFCLFHEKLQAGWKENLKNLSEHALLLGTSVYVIISYLIAF